MIPRKIRSLLSPIYRKIITSYNPILRKSKKNLLSIKDKYKGERCFLMGNGPSLNCTPLQKLEHEFVWGFNRCYLLFDRIKWKPTFYTAVDTLVVPDIAVEIHELVRNSSEILFFFPMSFYLNNILQNKENIIWFQQRGMDVSDSYNGYFSFDADEYLRNPNTVTITALQLSVYMGFNPIYLIGCDTNYFIPDKVIAKGKVKDPGTGELIDGYELMSTVDNDPNHFDPRYFGHGSKWHNPNVRGMIFGYQMAKKACDDRGVKVLNATIGGKLEVFPRVDFNDLF